MTDSGDGCSVCCSDSFQSSYTSSSDPRDRQPVGVANPMGTKLPYTTIVAAGPFAGYVFRVLCRKSYPKYGNRKNLLGVFRGLPFFVIISV